MQETDTSARASGNAVRYDWALYKNQKHTNDANQSNLLISGLAF